VVSFVKQITIGVQQWPNLVQYYMANFEYFGSALGKKGKVAVLN
jgi:hypothetical protein